MSEVAVEAVAPVPAPAPEATGEATAELNMDDVIAAAMGELPPVTEDAASSPPVATETDEKRKEALSTDGKLSEEKLSRAFAKVREQERRAKNRAQAIEADRQAILAARKEVDDVRGAYEPLRELATKNPVEFLMKSGWTKQQVADFILNDDKLPPERLIAESDKRISEKLEQLDRREREFSEKMESERVQGKAREYEHLVLTQIQSNLDQYPLTKRMSSRPGENIHKATLNYIGRIFKETGKALAPRDALVYFEKRFTEERDALLGDSHGQAVAGQTASKPGAGQPRALTNSATAERGVKPPIDAADVEAQVDKLIADAERGIFPD